MEIEYKGHRARITKTIIAWSMFGPDYGNICLDSTIISYKLNSIPIMCGVNNTYINILIKWFKDKVDEK